MRSLSLLDSNGKKSQHLHVKISNRCTKIYLFTRHGCNTRETKVALDAYNLRKTRSMIDTSKGWNIGCDHIREKRVGS